MTGLRTLLRAMRHVTGRGVAGLVAAAIAALVLGGCGSGTEVVEGIGTVSDGWAVEVVVDELVGPTQFVVRADGSLLVATINGGEDDGQGQVLEVDVDSGDATVVVDQLDKPTGIAMLAGELWIMERDRLSRGEIDGERTIVLDDLPNNGRSEGTLTVTPGGDLLYNTSGRKRGSEVTEGSGRLFEIDPTTEEVTELASGFKHAYAHVYDNTGTLWTTEMSDGRFDGEPAADEIVPVAEGIDHGWPTCVGNSRPVAEFGGTLESCIDAPSSVAVFAPSASPTGIAITADETQILVALWSEGRVVSLDTTEAIPITSVDVITGLSGPQHLVADGDAIYLSEFGTGRILKLAER